MYTISLQTSGNNLLTHLNLCACVCVPNLNKLISLLSQCLLAPLNSVSKLICVADGGVTPAQKPLSKLVPAVSSALLLAELICLCILTVESPDADGVTPAPTRCHTTAAIISFLLSNAKRQWWPGADDSSLHANSQFKMIGLIWESEAA